VKKNGFLTYENGLLLILGLTFGIVFVDRNALTNLMPFVVADLKLNNTQVGLLGAALSLTWAASGYVVGILSDRSGKRKPFLIATVVVFSLCSFLSGVAQGFAVLIAARFILGLSEGPILPISQSLMIGATSPGRRGVNAGALQAVFPNLLGNGLAPIVLVLLAQMYNWRTAFFLAGVPGLICAALIWIFAKEQTPEDRARLAAESPVKDPGKPLSSLDLLKIRNIAVCSVISVFMVGWMVMAWVWLPLFYTKMRSIPADQMGWLMGVLGFGAVFWSFFVPWLSEKFGRRPIVSLFCFVGMLVPLGALYAPATDLWVLGAIVVVGWSASGTFALFMATVPSESVPPGYFGAAMGLIQGLGEVIGGFSSPFLSGWLADQSSLVTPMFLMIACNIVAGVVALFLNETAPAVVARRADGIAVGATA
jgi:ACS family hexuronate transporter-like MFS transporter